MKILHKISLFVTALVLTLSFAVRPAYAVTYYTMYVLQGNTNSASDCLAFYNHDDKSLALDSTMLYPVLNGAFSKSSEDTIITAAPILVDEVDEETGSVPNSEKVVAWNYMVFDAYKGIRFIDSFATVGIDRDGVRLVADHRQFKMVADSKHDELSNNKAEYIDKETAIKIAQEQYLSIYPEIMDIESVDLVYHPVNETTYKLHYEVRVGGFVCFYVDAETGEVAK